MPPRQVWLFKLGCWVAWGTAALHVVGLMVAPLPAAAGSGADALRAAAAAVVVFPDGTERTLRRVFVGFSLSHALLAATLGAVGLAAIRRGRSHAEWLAGIARVEALVSLALLVISLTHFFLVPTFLVAVMLICFTLASVQAPKSGSG